MCFDLDRPCSDLDPEDCFLEKSFLMTTVRIGALSNPDHRTRNFPKNSAFGLYPFHVILNYQETIKSYLVLSFRDLKREKNPSKIEDERSNLDLSFTFFFYVDLILWF